MYFAVTVFRDLDSSATLAMASSAASLFGQSFGRANPKSQYAAEPILALSTVFEERRRPQIHVRSEMKGLHQCLIAPRKGGSRPFSATAVTLMHQFGLITHPLLRRKIFHVGSVPI